MRLRVDRFLNFVWAWAVERMRNSVKDQQEFDIWIARLSDPLPGEEIEAASTADWDDGEDSGFMDMMAKLGG